MAPQSSFFRRFWNWFYAYEWWILGLLCITALGLGFIGYPQYYALKKQAYTWWDVLYNTTRFFVLEGNDPMGPDVPLTLQLSRFLAPIPPVFAAAQAIFLVLQDEIRGIRLHFIRDHVVFCGLGTHGARLVEDFLAMGERVVVLEGDEDHAELETLQVRGALWVKGDPKNIVLHKKTRIFDAKYVVLMDDNDSHNLEQAIQMRTLINQSASRAVRVFIHLYSDSLNFIFRKHPIFTDAQDLFEGSLFNIYDTSARTVLQLQAPERSLYADQKPEAPNLDQPPVQVLLVGLGQLGMSLMRQLVLTGQYPNQEKLKLVVIDHIAQEKMDTFWVQYPELSAILEVEAINLDVRQLTKAKLDQIAAHLPFSAIYICLGNDTLGAEVALFLRQNLLGLAANVPIVTAFPQRQTLSGILSESSLFDPHKEMYVYPAIEHGCTVEVVVHQQLDVLARTIHEAYLKEAKVHGYYNPENPSNRDWTHLGEDFREANRHQADHIRVKLSVMGCTMQKIGGLLPKVDWQVLAVENEGVYWALAAAEHRRWMASRWLSGWRYAPKTDKAALLHENLVAWDALSDYVKSLDADTVKNIPALLETIGLEVCKKEG